MNAIASSCKRWRRTRYGSNGGKEGSSGGNGSVQTLKIGRPPHANVWIIIGKSTKGHAAGATPLLGP
jgi:hypothetical protein